jgi:hypothetical protein
MLIITVSVKISKPNIDNINVFKYISANMKYLVINSRRKAWKSHKRTLWKRSKP